MTTRDGSRPIERLDGVLRWVAAPAGLPGSGGVGRRTAERLGAEDMAVVTGFAGGTRLPQSGCMSQHSSSAQSPDVECDRRSLSGRLLALVVRPTAPPLWLGIVVAAAFIIAETVLVYELQEVTSRNAFGALFLLGVLVISAGWGFRLAVATTLASALAYLYFHLEITSAFVPMPIQDAVALVVFFPVALLANILAGQARLRAAESEQRRREAAALAEQQAALRRVATLVARGVDPSEVYPAAVAELSSGLGIDNVALLQYTPDEASVLLASCDERGLSEMHIGERISLDGESVAAMIQRIGAPARLDSYEGAPGPTAERMRQAGMRSAVGVPIIVHGRTWGALVIGSSLAEILSPDTEALIGDFADLVAIAVSNAENRAELTASRARIVTAGDQARRRFERDLHDGAQQGVISLGLKLRAVQASIPPEQQDLRDRLSDVVGGLARVSTELQEISRGIHPVILSTGGLGPAIKTLARRSAVPVALDLEVDRRMPESVEVAAYYVVAEALTNAAKHAQATEVRIQAIAEDDELRLTICDDGIGGAVAGNGSGLIGLRDRVEALAGHLDILSPAGSGTTLVAAIPLGAE
jgi:signal transduction histidine kinase